MEQDGPLDLEVRRVGDPKHAVDQREMETEQISVNSLDITAALIRISDRLDLVMSVYVPVCDSQVIGDTC
jgi:hypothetical protein